MSKSHEHPEPQRQRMGAGYTLHLGQLRTFIEVATALENGPLSYEGLANWFQENMEDLRRTDIGCPKKAAIQRAVTEIERRYGGRVEPGGRLIAGKSGVFIKTSARGLVLTKEGASFLPRASALLHRLDLAEKDPELSLEPMLAVGTHNIFEVAAYCAPGGIIEDWYARLYNYPTRPRIHLLVRDVSSHYEGLEQLETGGIALFLDATRDVPTVDSSKFVCEPLGRKVHLAAIVPLALGMASVSRKSDPLRLEQLRGVPLCFVHHRDIGERIADSGHRANRVALGSTAGVQRLIEAGQFVGICPAWKALFGDDEMKKHRVFCIAEEWACLTPYMVRRHSSRTSIAVSMFADCVADFFKQEWNSMACQCFVNDGQ